MSNRLTPLLNWCLRTRKSSVKYSRVGSRSNLMAGYSMRPTSYARADATLHQDLNIGYDMEFDHKPFCQMKHTYGNKLSLLYLC